MPRGDTHKAWGEAHRRRIVEKLAGGPMSSDALALALHLTRSAVLIHIRTLREAKQVRIADYVMQYRAREVPLYGIGGEPDARYVRARHMPRANAFEVQREKVRASIVKQLKVSRATAPELAILLGMSNATVNRHLPKMHAAKLIHRAAWVKREGGGIPVAIWAAGDKPDAPMHKLITKSRAGPLPQHQMDALWKKREARQIINTARKKPQGIFAALGL